LAGVAVDNSKSGSPVPASRRSGRPNRREAREKGGEGGGGSQGVCVTCRWCPSTAPPNFFFFSDYACQALRVVCSYGARLSYRYWIFLHCRDHSRSPCTYLSSTPAVVSTASLQSQFLSLVSMVSQGSLCYFCLGYPANRRRVEYSLPCRG